MKEVEESESRTTQQSKRHLMDGPTHSNNVVFPKGIHSLEGRTIVFTLISSKIGQIVPNILPSLMDKSVECSMQFRKIAIKVSNIFC